MKKLIVTVFFLLSINSTFGQENKNALDRIDQEIESLFNVYKAVGLSVAIVKNEKVIYSKGFGYRDLAKKLPVTTNTAFAIGSTTKAFTGALLGILESKNQVSLKHKPSQYIPDFTFYNNEMNNLITIEDLLCHKSGIGNQGTSEVFFPENDKLIAVQRLKYLKPEGEIKNSWIYSNMGYVLAGTIIEQITKKSWETNIQKNIFDPLAMHNSFTTSIKMKKSNNYSLPYGIYEGHTEKVKFEKYHSLSPAGAIKSSVSDLSKWMITWLNNGVFNEKQIIPKKYVTEATRLQNPKGGVYEKDAFLFGDGFGWRLKTSYGKYRIHHGGNTSGFTSNLVMFPFEKIGIVVLANQENSLLPYVVADNITRKLFNLKPVEEYPVDVTDIYKPSSEDKTLNKDKLPTHPLNLFIGTYKAKGLGKIEVIYENRNLYAVLPTFKFKLAHLNYNSFYFKGTKKFNGSFNPEFTVEFINNTEGDISQLNLHSQKEPVVFEKE